MQNFDQLNNMSTKWFSKMEIPTEAKKKRVELSLDYCEIIIMLFMMILEEQEKAACIAFAEERLRIIAERYVGKDDVAYINDWSKQEADKIVDRTIRNIEEPHPERFFEMPELGIRLPESEYWTSDERALLVGIECATNTSNFADLDSAMDNGKTRKVWMTEGDDRVRKTHEEVQGTEIPINEYFVVGNSYLLFPGDTSMNPEEKEILNCRCSLTYI